MSSTKINTGQVSVSTTAVQILPYNAGRSKVYLTAPGNVFFGADNTVTSSTGVTVNILNNDANAQGVLETKAAVWAISSAGSATVNFLETTD